MSKKILALVLALVLICSLVPAVSAVEASAKIDFTSTACRTAYSTSAQVWEQNGITVTNEKGASTSNVGDYSNPARFYKSSTVTIAYPGMTKIEIDCSTKSLDAKYITAWTDTLTAAGYAWTNENKIITITLPEAMDSLTLSPLAAQARAFYITVYAGGEVTPTTPTEPEATEATEPQETQPVVSDPAADSVLTIAQAIELGLSKEHNNYTAGKYYVTGKITEVYNTQYGNMKITDEAGNILTIYGTYDATGDIRYDALEVKPVAGDTVTIYGIVGQYNGTPQIKNGWITEHIGGEPVETEPTTPDPEADTVLTIAQAIELGASKAHNAYTAGKYYVTGKITEVYNTQYGNMKITDEAGNILTIYGTYDATGDIRYDALEVKPVAGDTVTIYGIVGQYNGTPQIKNGWITEHIGGEPVETQPTEPEETEPTTPVEPIDGTFVKITSADQLVSGQYVLVAGNGYAPTVLDGTWLGTGTPAVNGNTITAADAANYIWNITVDGTSVKLTDANGVTVAPKGGNNNGIKAADYNWDVLFSDGTFQFAGVGEDTVILACNSGEQGGNKFRGYKTTTLTGSYAAEYFSYFTLYKLEEGSSEPEQVKGDLTGDGVVTNDDVIVLLWHSMFPEENPIEINVDFSGDGVVTNDDVIILLWHSMFPEENPL